MTQPPEITPKSWAMVAVLGLTWGATFIVIDIALRGITPFWLAAARIGFAATLMALIWAVRGAPLFQARPTRANLLTLLTAGAFSAATPFMLLSWGQQYVTSGFAGVSMATGPLMVLPLAHFLVPGERMTWRKAVGFVIGFCGVVVLIGGNAFESSGTAFETPGRIACLGAATCYGFSSVLMRRLPAIDPIGLATVLLLIGSAIVVPVAWIVEGPPPMPDRQTLIVLAILGLIPTAAANLLRVLVVRTAGPVFMSLTGYQVPVWSVILGALILSEPLPPSLLLAMGLILGGVGLSQYGAISRLINNVRARKPRRR